MATRLFVLAALVVALLTAPVSAQTAPRVVDVPTRSGVTQRFLLLAPEQPKATVILFAGGQGGLQIGADGSLGWGKGNFLVRSREVFAGHGLVVAVVDAPSDRQSAPFLGGFRQTREQVTDVKAVIAGSGSTRRSRSRSWEPAAAPSPPASSARSCAPTAVPSPTSRA
ncbi:MAG: hypothetical protein ACREF4_00830 [Gammaproteobacteria bacterium]